ncbi:SLT domain-containing protein [Rossellomorea marisflavi]
MTLKAIELQVALPRTFEAGKATEQAQQLGQAVNHAASLGMQKETYKQRHTVNRMKGKAPLARSGKDPRYEDGKREEHHPFKGKAIDYSG